MRVVGYVRVSTEDQATSGLGLAAQRQSITAEASRRAWDVRWIADEGYSAKSLDRPGVIEALRVVESGDAEALVVAKLDRLSRSIHDFAGLMEQAGREGWALVCLDLGVDTTTPSGRLMANVFASFAQFERELIGMRTSDALQSLKRAGRRLGRPSALPSHVLRRIESERDGGATLRQIAATLEMDGVPTATGHGRWWPSTIRAALKTAELDDQARSAKAKPGHEVTSV